jgi:DNA polymerase (family 10)
LQSGAYIPSKVSYSVDIPEEGAAVARDLAEHFRDRDALQYADCKAHNVALRKLAVERRLRMNEYGIFRVARGPKNKEMRAKEGERIGGETEEEVFRAVGLVWIPPELREDRGEIQAAQARALLKLNTLKDIRGDLQMRSRWSDGSPRS